MSSGSQFDVRIHYNDATTPKGQVRHVAATVSSNGQWLAQVMSDDLWQIVERTATLNFSLPPPLRTDVRAIACVDIALLDDRSLALPPSRWRRHDGSDTPIDFDVELHPVVEACLTGTLDATGVRRGGGFQDNLETEELATRMREAGSLEVIPKHMWLTCRLFERGFLARGDDNPSFVRRLSDFYAGWPTHRRYNRGGITIDDASTRQELRLFAGSAARFPIWTDIRFPAAVIRSLFPSPTPSVTETLRQALRALTLETLTLEEATEIALAAGLRAPRRKIQDALKDLEATRGRGPRGPEPDRRLRQKRITAYARGLTLG